MNIAVFVGSLRKDSYNRAIYEIYKKLAGNRLIFTEVKIDHFPHYNADLHQNGFPNEVLTANQIIKESKGILFFTPEYNYSLPGFLKNGIDWLSRLDPQPFDKKLAAIIGASPGKIGTARMQYDLRKTGVFLNLHFLNKPEIMISNVHELINKDGEITDESTIKFLEKHIDAFIKFISVKQ